MKLHPQNDTPGEMGPAPSINPVTIGELVDVVDLIICSLQHGRKCYYADAALDRLMELKKRL